MSATIRTTPGNRDERCGGSSKRSSDRTGSACRRRHCWCALKESSPAGRAAMRASRPRGRVSCGQRLAPAVAELGASRMWRRCRRRSRGPMPPGGQARPRDGAPSAVGRTGEENKPAARRAPRRRLVRRGTSRRRSAAERWAGGPPPIYAPWAGFRRHHRAAGRQQAAAAHSTHRHLPPRDHKADVPGQGLRERTVHDRWSRAPRGGDVLGHRRQRRAYSLVAAKQPGGGARVFAFEPSYAVSRRSTRTSRSTTPRGGSRRCRWRVGPHRDERVPPAGSAAGRERGVLDVRGDEASSGQRRDARSRC